MCRSISIRVFTTAERLPLLASEVSTRMPNDIGPRVDGMRRLRTTAGAESSAQTDGADCATLGFETTGGLATATVAGGMVLGNGCGTEGGGLIDAMRIAGGALAFRLAVAE